MPALATAGVIGITYFFVRIAGKFLGASMGAAIIRDTPEVRRYLGLALIPNAGVSIGLAALGERILSPEMGALLSTVILSSAVLYLSLIHILVGFPMLAGFISKLLFATSALQSPHKMIPTLIVLAVSTILNAIYFLRPVSYTHLFCTVSRFLR